MAVFDSISEWIGQLFVLVSFDTFIINSKIHIISEDNKESDVISFTLFLLSIGHRNSWYQKALAWLSPGLTILTVGQQKPWAAPFKFHRYPSFCKIVLTFRPGNSLKCFWELICFSKKFLRKEKIYWFKNARFWTEMFLMMWICSKKQIC